MALIYIYIKRCGGPEILVENKYIWIITLLTEIQNNVAHPDSFKLSVN